jgi:hypothetical protein
MRAVCDIKIGRRSILEYVLNPIIRVIGESPVKHNGFIPLRPLGEREGPAAALAAGGLPHLTPTLSAPRGGEGRICGAAATTREELK